MEGESESGRGRRLLVVVPRCGEGRDKDGALAAALAWPEVRGMTRTACQRRHPRVALWDLRSDVWRRISWSAGGVGRTTRSFGDPNRCHGYKRGPLGAVLWAGSVNRRVDPLPAHL